MTTTFPFWGSASFEANYWDLIWLGDLLMPGRAKVSIKKSRRIDIKPVPGSDGAYLEDKGVDPAQITIELLQWKEEQWQEWVRIFNEIDPATAGTKRRPLEIYHPIPNTHGVTTVYVHTISAGQPEKAGARTVTIECVQWFPAPKPAKPKKDPKKKSGGAVEPATPSSTANIF